MAGQITSPLLASDDVARRIKAELEVAYGRGHSNGQLAKVTSHIKIRVDESPVLRRSARARSGGAHNWPHEYTVKAWRPDLHEAFEEACRAIAAHGTAEGWPPRPEQAIYHNRYLVIGGHKYWAMGPRGDLDPPEEMTVINRAVVTVV